MLLGIDVGGTFTDAVVIDNDRIINQAKSQTTHDDIIQGLLSVLEKVIMPLADKSAIQRVSLSTTLITNLVVTGGLPKVSLAVIPGPGVNCIDSFPVEPVIFDGYTDHRGKLVLPTSIDEKKLEQIRQSDYAVVSAKFSVRNNKSELVLAEALQKNNMSDIVLGHKVAGSLGFIRRTNSAYYTAATYQAFTEFMQTIKQALAQHAIMAPLYVLKADGGTMQVSDGFIREHTVEAYFTGPAASAVGIDALLEPEKRTISLDIGGTTTDIAFWEDGFPVLKQRGASIAGYPTAVRALHLRSVAVGGDSVVKNLGKITIGPERAGAAMALGGTLPTLTDAFLVLGKASFGDVSKAKKGLQALTTTEEDLETLAQRILDIAVDMLVLEIEDMIKEYALQPTYKVEDVVAQKTFVPELIIGVGGAAQGIVPTLEQKLKLPVQVPKSALVANAVGAAVARPTLVADLRADTVVGTCSIVQQGTTIKISSKFSLADAQVLLEDWLKEQAKINDIEFLGVQVVNQEEFPIVKGGYRLGKIIGMTMQLEPGILTRVKEDD